MASSPQMVGNPTPPSAEAEAPGRRLTIMRDETIRALQSNDLDYVIRCLRKDVPALQHMLSVAEREKRRRARVERHRIEAALRTVIRDLADGVPA